ncbi:MAG: autotransporter-associated beta strand repeat-containing protein, partial [Planctomycetes bacterium]|nr:autotransporter-associated beta strand repeat-containing protein [Planctomycetota bacterium]
MRDLVRLPALGVVTLVVILLVGVQSGSAQWQGATSGDGYAPGNTYDYDATSNWVGGTLNDSFLGTTLTGNVTLSLDAPRTTVATGLNLTYGGGFDFNLYSNDVNSRVITLGGDLNANATAGSQTISIGTALRPVTLNLNNATRNFIVGSSDTLIVNGVISSTTPASGLLTKEGAGTLILNAANTYSGATTVNAGELRWGVNDALSSGALTVNNGGTANVQTFTDSVGAVTINSGGTLSIGTGGSLTSTAASTVNGTISGTGTFSTGANTLTLTGGAISLASGTLTSGNLTMTGGTINAGNYNLGGTVTSNVSSSPAQISGNLNLGTAARTFTIAEGEAATDMLIDGVISGGTGGTLTKAGTGRLVLSGNSSSGYTDLTTVSAGTLNIQHASALGTTAVGTTVSSGATLELQGSIAVGAETLSLNGTGTTSLGAIGALRNISGNNSWGGAITLAAASRINSDSGTLTINSGSAISGASALTVGGAGNVTINDEIGIGAGTLTKDGGGVLTLAGANTSSGATTLNGGTLKLDYSTQNNSKLADAAALTLSRGTVELSGGSTIQAASATTLSTSAGASAITRSSGTSTLRMNAITRNVGSTIDFSAGSIADTDTLNANGILSGYATVASTNWAMNSINAVDGAIMAYSAYTSNTAGSLGASADNSNIVGTNTTTGAATINSIRFNELAARTLTLTGTLTVSSGGLLNTANVGANTSTITGGTLTPAGNTDLKIHQYNTSGALAIDSVIAGTTGGLTKSGPGTASLGGSTANTYTGTTFVNSGTLELNKSAAANAIGTGGLTINQTGVVKYTGASS